MKKIILLFSILAFISCKNSKNNLPEESGNVDSEAIVTSPKEEKKLTDEEIKSLVIEEYKSLNKDLGGFNRPPAMAKNSLEVLLYEIEGTKYESRVKKSIDSLNQIIEKNILKQSSVERKEYETTLKNSFLDNNLNIKVFVSGKDNTKITLTYPLFNEIWFRKFEKEGHFDKLNKKGFKEIIMKNGYDYGQGVKYN